jgi:hypothetical protein
MQTYLCIRLVIPSHALAFTFVQLGYGERRIYSRLLQNGGTTSSRQLTPEVQKKLIDGVHAEVGSRTIEEPEAERDEVLLGLIELRNKVAKSSQKSTVPVA